MKSGLDTWFTARHAEVDISWCLTQRGRRWILNSQPRSDREKWKGKCQENRLRSPLIVTDGCRDSLNLPFNIEMPILKAIIAELESQCYCFDLCTREMLQWRYIEVRSTYTFSESQPILKALYSFTNDSWMICNYFDGLVTKQEKMRSTWNECPDFADFEVMRLQLDLREIVENNTFMSRKLLKRSKKCEDVARSLFPIKNKN